MTLDEILSDPFQFISRLSIVDKNGKVVLFEPNAEQIKIIETLEKKEDTFILKPRQIGSSTVNVAYMFWKWFTATEPVSFVFMSHKSASSKHLLSMAKNMYYALPEPLQRTIEIENTTTFKLKDSGAELRAVSAKSKGGMRSFTCSMLLISELAFAEQPEEMLAAAVAALNDGQLVVETTANYFNDIMYRSIMKVQNGSLNANLLFFPWTDHLEYQKEIPEDFSRKQDELSLDMTDEQVYWRREKLSKVGGLHKFRREYPLTIEEAYALTGNSYFSEEDMRYVTTLTLDPEEMIYLQPPVRTHRYAIGVDVAAGVGRDYSVIYVLCKNTKQISAIYRSNNITPVLLAHRIRHLSAEYNDALTLIESNNYGNVVLNELIHEGFGRCWKSVDDKDWLTTSKSKKEMFENLKKRISSGQVRQIDNILMSELRSLTVTDNGTITIPDNMDGHGDSAIAFALAHICLRDVTISQQTSLPDWIERQKTQTAKRTLGAAVGITKRY